MKTSALQELKELSKGVLLDYPPRLTMDGLGNLYDEKGQPMSLFEVLRGLAVARRNLEILNQTIQALEGRKAPK